MEFDGNVAISIFILMEVYLPGQDTFVGDA